MSDRITVNDDECFAPIPRHPNYEIDYYGQIRHKKRKKILKQQTDKDGYKVLSLGNVDNVSVHRTMCETFFGPPEGDKNQVNHINTKRDDNFVLNLEWSTGSDNVKWAVHKGNIDMAKLTERAAEVNPKPVRISETGETFDSVKSCADYFGVRPTNISRVLTGNRKGQRFHGYHLEYAEKEV